MFRRFISVILAAAVTLPLISTSPTTADTITNEKARFADKVRAEIEKLGVGRESILRVRLKDKSKINGYLSEVTENYFVVADQQTGKATIVAYPDVTQVQGHNLSKGVKIAIAAGVIVAVIIVLYLVRGAFCDGC